MVNSVVNSATTRCPIRLQAKIFLRATWLDQSTDDRQFLPLNESPLVEDVIQQLEKDYTKNLKFRERYNLMLADLESFWRTTGCVEDARPTKEERSQMKSDGRKKQYACTRCRRFGQFCLRVIRTQELDMMEFAVAIHPIEDPEWNKIVGNWWDNREAWVLTSE